MANLAAVLAHHARLTPDRVAVVCGAERLTYGALQARARALAAGLARAAVSRGDRVVLSCPNVPWFPIVYFGILEAGAAVVPLNVLLKPAEIAYHLRDCGAAMMLAFEGTAELPMAAMAAAACAETGIRLVIIPASGAATPRDGSIESLLTGGPDDFDPPRVEDSDTAVILYTSGTTGQPKGAELTHGNMLSNAIAAHDMFRPAFDAGTESLVTLITLPLFHSTAQTAQMNAGLYGGFRLVLLPRFDAAAVLDTFVREQVGLWVAVPTMYWALLQYARTAQADVRGAVRSLRLCASGGAPMPVEILTAFEQTFSTRILEGYGLSEAAPVVAFNQLQRPAKIGTIGFPIFGVEVRLVDDQDREVPVGERGELVIRGPNVMKGYFGRAAATAEILRDGWLHTGDIAVLDAEGYLAIVDRKKDLILRGGFNVYPREIEEVLLTHPAIAMCAVVGRPDERLGEEVRAVVVRRPGMAVSESELISWSRARMAAYKYPRAFEFRDALPMNATGKVLKRDLR